MISSPEPLQTRLCTKPTPDWVRSNSNIISIDLTNDDDDISPFSYHEVQTENNFLQLYKDNNEICKNQCTKGATNTELLSDEVIHRTIAVASSEQEQIQNLYYKPQADDQVTLLVDSREKENIQIQQSMAASNISCEIATLVLGDFLWVVKSSTTNSLAPQNVTHTANSRKHEGNMDEYLVLDCIAERKTAADLASSILDGRYDEQKNRLKKCGVKSKFYIVEGLSLRTVFRGNMSSETLRTAMASIVVRIVLFISSYISQ